MDYRSEMYNSIHVTQNMRLGYRRARSMKKNFPLISPKIIVMNDFDVNNFNFLKTLFRGGGLNVSCLWWFGGESHFVTILQT